MKKKISLVIILIVLAILLSGCTNIDYNVKVNKNGSGEITYFFGIDKGVLNDKRKETIKHQRWQAEEKGYKAEPFEDEKYVGFKATKIVEDLFKEPILTNLFTEKYIEESEKNNINIQKKGFEEKIYQNTEINLELLKDLAKLGATITYNITLPIEVDKTNATKISEDGKTLSWNLKPGEVNKIEFEAKKGKIYNWILIIIIIVVIIVVLLLIFKDKIKAILKKQKKSKAKVSKK